MNNIIGIEMNEINPNHFQEPLIQNNEPNQVDAISQKQIMPQSWRDCCFWFVSFNLFSAIIVLTALIVSVVLGIFFGLVAFLVSLGIAGLFAVVAIIAFSWLSDKSLNTENEYHAYIELLNETQIKYNEDDEQHEKVLKQFYENGQECFSNEQKENSIPWKVYGFRVEAPRDDFGEAGLHSLKFMAYFIQHFNTQLRELFKVEQISFVKVSNLITLSLRSYLLLKSEDKQSPVTKQQMKAFVYNLAKADKESNLLLKMESEILIYYLERVSRMNPQAINEQTTNSIINEAILICGEALKVPIDSPVSLLESIQGLMQNNLKSSKNNNHVAINLKY